MTNKKFTLSLLILLLKLINSPAFGQSPFKNKPVFPEKEWMSFDNPEEIGFSSPKLLELKSFLKTIDTTAMLVIVGGQILFKYGDTSEVSYIGSMRKSILAMLYGKYVENGTIALDKTLHELNIGDIGGLLPIEQTATIRNIISARSGVYHLAANGGDQEVKPERGSKKTGSYFLYNNWDFNVAGSIFEKLVGHDIYSALQTDLATPITMQDFDLKMQRKAGDPSRSVHLGYHMWLSTRDMARIGYLMLREGSWSGKNVIPKSWITIMTSLVTPPKEMNPEDTKTWGFGYGYMWWVNDESPKPPLPKGTYWARGLFGQIIMVIPSMDMVIAHKVSTPLPDHLWKKENEKNAKKNVTWKQFISAIKLLFAARQQDTISK